MCVAVLLETESPWKEYFHIGLAPPRERAEKTRSPLLLSSGTSDKTETRGRYPSHSTLSALSEAPSIVGMNSRGHATLG